MYIVKNIFLRVLYIIIVYRMIFYNAMCVFLVLFLIRLIAKYNVTNSIIALVP